MGDSFFSNDDTADDGSADHAAPSSGPSASRDDDPAKPVSEPPPIPRTPSGKQTPTGQPDQSEWSVDWEDVDPAAVAGARETRELPAIDRHEPPKASPAIEGLKRTADGSENPTAAPGWSEPDGLGSSAIAGQQQQNLAGGRSRPTGAPVPPHIRNPRRSDPVNVEVAVPAAPDWTAPAPVAAAPVAGETWDHAAAAASAGSQVTELDIARLARTTSTRTVKLGAVDVTFGSQRSLAAVGAVAMAILVALLALAVSGLGRGDDSIASDASDGSREAAVFDDDEGDLLVSGEPPASPSISELARSTVQIVGFDEDGASRCVGSGIIVEADGLILTNAHVINRSATCDITTIGVAVTEGISDPPELLYEAKVVATDNVADLAVVQIVGPLASTPDARFPRTFPAAVLGDSDAVQLGDDLRILGYPVIGGETITSTSGSVSGFSPQDGLGDRALIKTDAAISAGNSGGMALNASGEVIGIPTRAQATESGPTIDCRPLQDTNQDGEVNNEDDCNAVGGFLNGIRSINLASDLLKQAESALVAGNDPDRAESTFDLTGVVLTNPRFSVGEADDAPVEEVLAAPAGTNEICLFVDWTGIPENVPWDAVWLVNGTQISDFGRLDQVWTFGKKGRNFWYCALDENGHQAGVYEMGLFLDNQLMFVEGVRVYEDDVDVYDVTWVNRTEQDLCGLAFNPKADSRHVGLNELEVDMVIGVGEAITMEVAEGEIVVEAFDCSGRAIALELEGLNVPDDIIVDGEEVPFVIGRPSADSDGDDN